MSKTATVATPEGVTPPKIVQATCRRGLTMLKGRGRRPQLAKAMAGGEGLTPEKIRSLKSYHDAHADDDRTASPPSAGYVSFLMHGGEAGRQWAQRQVGRLENSEEAAPVAKKAAPVPEAEVAPRAPVASTPPAAPEPAKVAVMREKVYRAAATPPPAPSPPPRAAAEPSSKTAADYARAVYGKMRHTGGAVADKTCDLLKSFLAKG